jgi:MSHA biogenesis protein MshP
VIVRRAQCGFSLVSAIFLLVVLAVLGVAMVSFSTMQNQSQALDVMGSRAYQAAQAGIEWAAYNIETTPGISAPAAVVFAPGTGTALAGNLSEFQVTVSIVAASAIEDASSPPDGTMEIVWIHDITASAVWGTAGTENSVVRVINAKK